MIKEKKTAAVFCSARDIEVYKKLGFNVGKLLGELDYNIIYGGGYQGVMGAVSKGGESAGSRVTGISTYHLLDLEVSEYDNHNTHFVQTMGERKQIQLGIADVVIILPGGFGTLDELFETLTFNQIGITKNKILVFDIELQPILERLTRLYEERGTISVGDGARIQYVTNLDELKKELEVIKNDSFFNI